ncbi:UDP-glucuronic acid decarboxylase family protein [Phenylobacterium soli]|uniref:UDP-glucuronate decarboxylase n=1 Tax=Phenylobacterium soli TaxID=2170551 RepID=A0A328AK48_9CAUL|nr:UDP-glucuronic acid decarboxylase family protein [Phenylobacterium soli]RAK53774.1 SDR family NAD-dependent epimerase/dehydratase [Phenylobacterium soli]
MRTKRSTILVTGAAGFLGFHLCRRLLDDGHPVIGLDDMSTGVQAHVDELESHPDFRFVRHDVREPAHMLALENIGQIFNLACPASPVAYQAQPIKTLETSVLGVRNMLQLAMARGARMVHTSTSEVYGDPQVHPQPETYWGNVDMNGPRACYDEGKRCAETMIYDYRRVHRVDCRVVRIFNTYGPGMREDDGRVVSTFVVEALKGSDITIQGDGSHTRSMCYVDDMVDGLVRMMAVTPPPDGPVNLGNPREISVREFAMMVLAATGSDSRVVFTPEAIDDPRQRRPDISRAGRVLGWTPKTPLEDGLARTIDYFRGRMADRAPRDVAPGAGRTAEAAG